MFALVKRPCRWALSVLNACKTIQNNSDYKHYLRCKSSKQFVQHWLIWTLTALEPNTNRNTLRCNHSFVTCEQNIKVCMLCTSSLMLEKCKYSCEEICSGRSCLEIVDNETVRQCGKEVLFRLFNQVWSYVLFITGTRKTNTCIF